MCLLQLKRSHHQLLNSVAASVHCDPSGKLGDFPLDGVQHRERRLDGWGPSSVHCSGARERVVCDLRGFSENTFDLGLQFLSRLAQLLARSRENGIAA